MAFLRNLFGGGPQLPEPIRDAFHGEEGLRREMAQLRDGQWRPAATRFARTRDADDRAFVSGMMLEHAGSWIDEWHRAEPMRDEPLILRGLGHIASAWAARGSDRAEDVPEEAWPVFHERLQRAEEDLQAATGLDARDALPWSYLQLSGRGLDLGVDELRGRYEEGRTRAPQGWHLSWSTLESLTEKWSGTHELMFQFAREVSNAPPRAAACTRSSRKRTTTDGSTSAWTATARASGRTTARRRSRRSCAGRGARARLRGLPRRPLRPQPARGVRLRVQPGRRRRERARGVGAGWTG